MIWVERQGRGFRGMNKQCHEFFRLWLQNLERDMHESKISLAPSKPFLQFWLVHPLLSVEVQLLRFATDDQLDEIARSRERRISDCRDLLARKRSWSALKFPDTSIRLLIPRSLEHCSWLTFIFALFQPSSHHFIECRKLVPRARGPTQHERKSFFLLFYSLFHFLTVTLFQLYV